MIIKNETYRGKSIEIEARDDGVILKIDGKKIGTNKSTERNSFTSQLLPYKSYPDLISLGKAVVRSKNWQQVAHEIEQ